MGSFWVIYIHCLGGLSPFASSPQPVQFNCTVDFEIGHACRHRREDETGKRDKHDPKRPMIYDLDTGFQVFVNADRRATGLGTVFTQACASL